VKTPDRITTIAIATIATVLLGTVAFALAGPPASGPSDDELPVIATTVLPHAEATATDATPAPLPHAEGIPAVVGSDHVEAEDTDEDDHHETVAPKVRVEDPDHDDDDDDDDHSSDEEHDGESSESTKADEPH
jgi:hypothetical protein